MREIKFEYLVVFESGEVKKTILTLEEIEKNSEFSSFGQAMANVANGVKEIYRRQYTGLKDKNGKEIYEGDIVKCNNNHIGAVIWEKNDCCFNVDDYYDGADDYPTMAFMEGQPFEVIGNIYENPELLEK